MALLACGLKIGHFLSRKLKCCLSLNLYVTLLGKQFTSQHMANSCSSVFHCNHCTCNRDDGHGVKERKSTDNDNYLECLYRNASNDDSDKGKY